MPALRQRVQRKPAAGDLGAWSESRYSLLFTTATAMAATSHARIAALPPMGAAIGNKAVPAHVRIAISPANRSGPAAIRTVAASPVGVWPAMPPRARIAAA